MSSKFSHESVIEFMMFANAKPAFAFLTSSSCGLLMKCGHFCEMKPNFQLYAQLFATTRQCWLQSHRVSVSWLLNSSSVFAGELPTMSVCHWMFNRLQTFMGCSLKTAPFGQKKKPLWDHREWSKTAKFAGRTFKAPFMRLQSQLIIVCGTVLTSEIANSFIINILSPLRLTRSCRFRHYFYANSWTTPGKLSQTWHKVVILKAPAHCNLCILSLETCSMKTLSLVHWQPW